MPGSLKRKRNNEVFPEVSEKRLKIRQPQLTGERRTRFTPDTAGSTPPESLQRGTDRDSVSLNFQANVLNASGQLHNPESTAEVDTAPSTVPGKDSAVDATIDASRPTTKTIPSVTPSTFVPAQYRDWEGKFADLDDPAAYAGASKIIWTHDGKKPVLALLLSREHNFRMVQAILSGRDYRICKDITEKKTAFMRAECQKAQDKCNAIDTKFRQIATGPGDLGNAIDTKFMAELNEARAAREYKKSCAAQIEEAERELAAAAENFHKWLRGVNYMYDSFFVERGLVNNLPIVRGADELLPSAEVKRNEHPEETSEDGTEASSASTTSSADASPRNTQTEVPEQQSAQPCLTNGADNGLHTARQAPIPGFCNNCGIPVSDWDTYHMLHRAPCAQLANFMGYLNAFDPWTGRRIKPLYHEQPPNWGGEPSVRSADPVPSNRHSEKEEQRMHPEGADLEEQKSAMGWEIERRKAVLVEAQYAHDKLRDLNPGSTSYPYLAMNEGITAKPGDQEAHARVIFAIHQRNVANLRIAEQGYEELVKQCKEAGFFDIIPENRYGGRDRGYDVVAEWQAYQLDNLDRQYVEKWLDAIDSDSAFGAFEPEDGSVNTEANLHINTSKGTDPSLVRTSPRKASFNGANLQASPTAARKAHDSSKPYGHEEISDRLSDHVQLHLSASSGRFPGESSSTSDTNTKKRRREDSQDENDGDGGLSPPSSKRFRHTGVPPRIYSLEDLPAAPIDPITGKRCPDDEGVKKHDASIPPPIEHCRFGKVARVSADALRRGHEDTSGIMDANRSPSKTSNGALDHLSSVDVHESWSHKDEGGFESYRKRIDDWAIQMRDGYL